MKKFDKEKSVNDLFEKNSRVEPQKIWAETWNGRAAMVGLFAAAISDITTGHMFFGMFQGQIFFPQNFTKLNKNIVKIFNSTQRNNI